MNYKKWQPEEIAFLKANYSSASKVELGIRLSRSFNRIKAKASELRLERKSGLQREELEQLYCDKQLPAIEVARLLGRSKACILKNLHKYSIPVRTTADGLKLFAHTSQMSPEILEDLYHQQELSCNEIADKLGVGGVTILRYLQKFNIALRNHSDAGKINWQDPEFVRRMLIAFNKKPTKLERQLEAILKKHFPEFKYNGDARLGVTLGGLTPDFVNINGKKQVIELFGDYWHSPEIVGDDWRRGELGKIMIYNSVGWNCLVIWERELKELTEEQLVTKIEKYIKRRSKHD